ncbi:GntR family transcriptional regulator [Cupriavidus necator]|uniref:GntR family transcriptional regulator n=1 Tax=Cupriavidus necator TaxID=106590 RepID=UPI001E2B4D28|nr:GntR family transcriptional regulator [Cupriavidus necator]MDX6012167.1 GntR family transcriptional regulator [Cupriavidus necator]
MSVSRMAEGDVGGVIADPLGISRVTARRAQQVLAEEGAITRSRGAGTFIAPRPEPKWRRGWTTSASWRAGAA